MTVTLEKKPVKMSGSPPFAHPEKRTARPPSDGKLCAKRGRYTCGFLDEENDSRGSRLSGWSHLLRDAANGALLVRP